MNTYRSYYPRPLLKRDSFFSLCGKWKLNGSDIEVPFPPESDLSGYKGPLKKLNYEKSFSLPALRTISFITNSAIGERQIFPWHTNKILVIINYGKFTRFLQAAKFSLRRRNFYPACYYFPAGEII